MKRQLKDKARHAYGLLNVLKCDINTLRKDISDYDLYRVRESLSDTSATLQTLQIIIEEIEYILNLDKEKRL